MHVLYRETKYIGYIASKDDIEPDTAKFENDINWSRTTKPEDVRQFPGCISYYQWRFPVLSICRTKPPATK